MHPNVSTYTPKGPNSLGLRAGGMGGTVGDPEDQIKGPGFVCQSSLTATSWMPDAGVMRLVRVPPVFRSTSK